MWKWTKFDNIKLIILDGDSLNEEYTKHFYCINDKIVKTIIVTKNNKLENVIKYFDIYDLIQEIMNKEHLESYSIISISNNIAFLKSMMEYHIGNVLVGNLKYDYLKIIPDYLVSNLDELK